MKKCPQCEHSVEDADDFCENCGLYLQKDRLAASGATVFDFQLPAGLGSWKTLKWIIAAGALGLFILGNLSAGAVIVYTQMLQGREVVEVPVPRVVTATPTLTPTSTPGPSPTPSPTGTPTSTATSTPTLTPIPTTIPEIVLKPGEKWYGDGLSLLLSEPVEIYPDLLRVTLIIKNEGDEMILFELRSDNYRMISSLHNEVVYLRHSLFSGGISLQPGEERVLSNRGIFDYNLANPEVTHVQIEVGELNRLGTARWYVKIPH